MIILTIVHIAGGYLVRWIFEDSLDIVFSYTIGTFIGMLMVFIRTILD